jgi:2-iminoacetate synthase ThiH
MMKIMSGGRGSRDETNLMVTEKVQALLEASASLLAGATASSIVDRYREHVAANAKRLSH